MNVDKIDVIVIQVTLQFRPSEAHVGELERHTFVKQTLPNKVITYRSNPTS